MAFAIGTEACTSSPSVELLPKALKMILSRATLSGSSINIWLGEGDVVDTPFVQSVIFAFDYNLDFMRDLVESDAWWKWSDSGPPDGPCPHWWKNPDIRVVGAFAPSPLFYLLIGCRRQRPCSISLISNNTTSNKS